SSAEEIPVSEGVAHVLERSRVHQKRFAGTGQMNTQRVSVTVPGRARTLRSCIDRQLLARGRVCHEIKTALPECSRCFRRLVASHFLKFRHARGAQQPDSLFPRTASKKFEVAALIKNSSRAQWVQQVLSAITSRIEEPSAIVVARTRHRSGAPKQ